MGSGSLCINIVAKRSVGIHGNNFQMQCTLCSDMRKGLDTPVCLGVEVAIVSYVIRTQGVFGGR